MTHDRGTTKRAAGPGLLDRRTFVRLAGAAVAGGAAARLGVRPGVMRASSPPDAITLRSHAARPVPTPAQLQWQRDERALFLHFGVNTYTDREWGDGREDPVIFDPAALDARQWARAARAGGFRMMILTAKHHDGFCLWPTATTTHSVASSPFRGGRGDVVREMVDACRTEGLRVGLYCSPWDRNAPAYGDSPRYNDLYCDQLTELLTRYGRVDEVWFDGANGEGPNGKKQTYDWPRFWSLVRRLQPESVIFSDAGPDVRWIGNERGAAGTTNWSLMNPDAVPYPGADGPGIIAALQEGDPNGTVWRPGETDVSIRPGWFHHPAEDPRVKSAADLVDLYFTSVGRNSKLLLNVPPTRAGLLHDTDVARITDARSRLDAMLSDDVVASARLDRRAMGATRHRYTVDLGRLRNPSVIDLREDIALGQVVSGYRLEVTDPAPSRIIASGTTIGYRKLDRLPPTGVRRLTLTLDTVAPLEAAVELRVYE